MNDYGRYGAVEALDATTEELTLKKDRSFPFALNKLDTDVGQDMRIKGVIGILDGAAVVKVPAVRLPKDFGFMLAHPSATVAPTKLEDYTIHQNPPGISGSLVEGRICMTLLFWRTRRRASTTRPSRHPRRSDKKAGRVGFIHAPHFIGEHDAEETINMVIPLVKQVQSPDFWTVKAVE